ncbi:cytochrome c3 family protein [Dechloromonas sp. A34]|uniref:cytochrome c3 family protein n=1 Tax=Dechloromonas sp. A34 TaxID=447588 RepID=UPI002248FE19|nr:cytochrome c3 family protein [Dechloromonas sp. A34]
MRVLVLALVGLLAVAATQVAAAPVSNIRMTKHNLSKDGGQTVRANATPTAGQSTTDQICVFCHTPHAASSGKSPLWNRATSAASTYTGYTSLSMDADGGAFQTDNTKGRPAGASLLCLSCHDGTIALGNLNVLNGRTPVIIDMVGGTADDKMPTGSGTTTGFTRVIGADLSNDHPISVTYNNALASADKELRPMNASQQHPISGQIGSILGIRSPGYKPLLPLAPTGTAGAGQVQCSTCHDPHLYDSADPNRKFLRANRLQVTAPTGGAFSEANDIICLACHDKMGTEWSNSAHANTSTASYAYTGAATTQRQFAAGTPVWKAACLNCHDTHTVAGARRLLREGTTSTATPKAGGKSAIEETCYQCHTAYNATTPPNVLTQSGTLTATTGVPNIKSEFGRPVRMPIKDADQGGGGNTTEVHDISDADFSETREKLGLLDKKNRHVECTDCHNPHRVIRNTKIDGSGVTTQRTHVAGGSAGSYTVESDGNVASGVLRGAWGVEPVDALLNGITDWPEAPTNYEVKKGVTGTGTARSSTWLTREYQLCFKCHSTYSNTAGSFPTLGHTGGTPSGTNGMTTYTNVAAEFAVNATDPPSTGTDQGEKGEGSNSPEDSASIEPIGSYPGNATTSNMTATTNVNHRSWHPVRWPTGRSRDERRMQATGGNFRAPFGTRVGTQTMHCSDCHGNATSWTQGTGPKLDQVQGPHGSEDYFLLKGSWSSSTSISSPGFCGNCHNPSASSGSGDDYAGSSGFNNSGEDGGGGHGNEHGGKACVKCHVAVPHGWRNKAFLVNLNCVGREAGATYTGCMNFSDNSATVAPYYQGATLRVKTWPASGNWSANKCGKGSSTARDWMRSVCDN